MVELGRNRSGLAANRELADRTRQAAGAKGETRDVAAKRAVAYRGAGIEDHEPEGKSPMRTELGARPLDMPATSRSRYWSRACPPLGHSRRCRRRSPPPAPPSPHGFLPCNRRQLRGVSKVGVVSLNLLPMRSFAALPC